MQQQVVRVVSEPRTTQAPSQTRHKASCIAAGVEDMWLCRACELKEEGRPPPQCCLCPVAGGALKPTTVAGLWAHAACMQWIPEVHTLSACAFFDPKQGKWCSSIAVLHFPGKVLLGHWLKAGSPMDLQVTVGDMSRMEPVDRIQAIQKERWELLCGVCRQRCGAKVRQHAPLKRCSWLWVCMRGRGEWLST
jgi:PHD-zinc-finger like domain